MLDVDLRCARTISGHNGSISFCQFSPDGSRILSRASGEAKLWQVSDGSEVGQLLGPGERSGTCRFSPDGSLVVLAADDRTLRIFASSSARLLATYATGDFMADDCSMSRDGGRILWGTHGVMKILEHPGGRIIVDFPLREHFWTMKCAFTEDEASVVAADNLASEVRLWDIADARQVAALHKDLDYVAYLAKVNKCLRLDQDGWGLSQDGSRAVAIFYGALKVWKIRSGAEESRFVRVPEEEWEWHPRHLLYGRITAWTFSPDATRLAIGYDDGATWVWETTTGKLLLTLPQAQRQSTMSLAFSPDGAYLLSGYVDGTLNLWDAVDGRRLSAVYAHRGSIDACAFSYDKKMILTASSDSTLKLWELEG